LSRHLRMNALRRVAMSSGVAGALYLTASSMF
jgi:hypothetical protein